MMDNVCLELMRAVKHEVDALKVKELVLGFKKVELPKHVSMCASAARNARTVAATIETHEAVTVAVVTTFIYRDVLSRFMSTIPATPMSGSLTDDHKLDTPHNGGDDSSA